MNYRHNNVRDSPHFFKEKNVRDSVAEYLRLVTKDVRIEPSC